MFATHTGDPLLASNVFSDYKKMQCKAVLRSQTYDDLKHATANLLMESAATSLTDVSKVLGHAGLQGTNNFYKHLPDEAPVVSMDKLRGALGS